MNLDTHDPTGKTDATFVTTTQAAFQAWYKTAYHHEDANATHVLATHFDVHNGIQFAKAYMKERTIPFVALDSRLPCSHSLRIAGMDEHSIRDVAHITSLDRLLSFTQPAFFEVPDHPVEGQYFQPITERYLKDNPDVVKKLLSRAGSMRGHDAARLITGTVMTEQPPGRYVTAGDVIAMWNRSKGKCVCGMDANPA